MTALVPNRDKLCRTGLHLWRTQFEADRCCFGWIPVRVPLEFRKRLQDWTESPPLPFGDDRRAWIRVLIPEHETDLIQLLRLREPDVFRSSTGSANPWLKFPI